MAIYPYAIYPLLIAGLGTVRPRQIEKNTIDLPFVTVVITAFNEVRHIEATVRNKLVQIYPSGHLELLVVSDGSDDGTDAVVATLARQDGRVRLLRQEPRQGKTAGLNLALTHARGDVIVFADANSIYRPDALQRLVCNFADPEVGYVTGRMLYVNPDGSLVGDGCSAYMRYENRLRAAETAVGSIAGVDGGIDAVRRSLYRPMRADQLPDLVLPLTVVEQGFRVVFEPRAVVNEDTLTGGTAEYRMRVRVALRAFWALWDKRALLNPLRYPLFSWQLASHKLLRYLSFLPLVAAAALNWVLLSEGPLYRSLAAAQAVFFAMAVMAVARPALATKLSLPSWCYYFLLLNWTSAAAWVLFLRGRKQILWQPRTR